MNMDSIFRSGTYERPANATDGEFLRQLFRSSLAPLPGVSPEQGAVLADTQFYGREQTYATAYPDSLNRILCLGDGTPVGRSLSVRRNRTMRIIDLAVVPECQGRGIATAALRRLQSEAVLEGLELHLSVVISNRAIALYQRLGFHIVGRNAVSLDMAWSLPNEKDSKRTDLAATTSSTQLPPLITLYTGEVLERALVVKKILSFLQQVGFVIEFAILPKNTFLPGIELVSGGLRVNLNSLKYPGDLLHEAGHLAVMTSDRRLSSKPKPTSDGAEEMAAMAWSYAAAVHLDLPPSLVFHEDGYRGQAQNLISGYSRDICPGVPLLQWLGLCQSKEDGVNARFPSMLRWIYEDAVSTTALNLESSSS